jgi:hypothetical protein
VQFTHPLMLPAHAPADHLRFDLCWRHPVVMLVRALMLAGAVCCLALGGAEADADAAAKAQTAKAKPKPIPTEAAQADALKVLKTTFKADFLRHKPEEHLAFARHLLEQGVNITENDASRYEFLHEACEQAAKGGDAELIRRGVQELSSYFVIDAVDEHLRLLLSTKEFVSAEALLGVVEAELGIASAGHRWR